MRNIKVIEVCNLLKLSDQTVNSWIAEGKLKATPDGKVTLQSVIDKLVGEIEELKSKKNPELEDLKKQKLAVDTEHRQLKLDLERKAYVTKREVAVTLADAAQSFSDLAQQMVKRLPYEIAGKDIKTVTSVLEDSINRLATDFSNRLSVNELD